MMTPDQALAGLYALIGGGGLTSLGVAWLGYKTAAAKGRPTAEAPVIAIGAAPNSKWEEPAAIALQSIASHLCGIRAIMEIEADERWDGKNFRDLVSDRMMRFMTQDVRGKD